MSFLSNLFGRGSNEYVYLRESFANHHHSIEEDLNKNHPHATGTLARYGVDLKKLRKRAAVSVAALAVAGLLMALPRQVGGPSQQENVPPDEDQIETSVEEDSTIRANQRAGSFVSTPPPATIHVPAPPSDNNDDKNGNTVKKGHRGHTRGRSYLAPPKRHGLHDLGLHKGDKNDHPIKNAGKGKSV